MHHSDEHILITTSSKADGNLDFRFGDEAEVIEKRRAFLAQHGLRPEDCVIMSVEQGDDVRIVTAADKSTDPRAAIATEAFITTDTEVALFLLTADCQPITLFDKEQRVIALAHLGWKPTDLQLIKKVIEKMVADFGCQPEHIHAWIGPGIKKESYVFDEPEQRNREGWRPSLETLPSGETSVDVLGYNVAQMKDAGIREEHITIDPTDTAASPDHFSHYRSNRSDEPQGRFATVVMLR